MRRTNRTAVSWLGWPQSLLLLTLSMTLFSFLLIQQLASPSSSPSTYDSPHLSILHSLPPSVPLPLPHPHQPTNYSHSNGLIQQQLLSHLLASKDFVRSLRRSKVIMAWNETARNATHQLQDITRCYLMSQYGRVPHHNLLAMTLRFPDAMIDNDVTLRTCVTPSQTRTVFIELAPMMMLPHAFYTVRLPFSSFPNSSSPDL